MVVALHRRTLLRSLPFVLVPTGGCSGPDRSPSVTLRMVRVVNLSGAEQTVELTASPVRNDGVDTLYSGGLGTQEGDAGAGEVVLQPAITEPLRFDYGVAIDGGVSARLPGRVLESAYRSRSEDGPVGCLDVEFVVRDPTEEAETWGDYDFWADCESAPGTVEPSSDS